MYTEYLSSSERSANHFGNFWKMVTYCMLLLKKKINSDRFILVLLLNLSAMQETGVLSLGWKDGLEKEVCRGNGEKGMWRREWRR